MYNNSHHLQTFFIFPTKTLYWLNSNCPFLTPCSSWQPSFYFVSIDLTTLGTSYKWSLIIFILLWLLILFSIMCSRFIHVVACVRIFFKSGSSAMATELEKVSFHSNPKERQCQRMLKLPHNALISHTSKVMLKILQARLQQYMNRELPNVQTGFRKHRGTRDQIDNIHWLIEKAREFQKNINFCFIDYAKAFDCVDHNKLENSLRDATTRLPYLSPEKSECRSRSNS